MNPADSFKSLDDWLPWLETLSPREIVMDLDRVHAVLKRLAIARPGLVVNVAGTNGKGSSVAMLEALLRRDGMRTGCYTSPHVVHYNERIRIDGTPAGDEAVIAALQRVEAVRSDVPLTFFEFGTLAALVAFDVADVDAWILEIGMGGRLDAVNAVEPDASLITNVSLDHCAWLGNDVESIAAEKAGVMRRDKPVVFGAPDMPDAIQRAADACGARLLRAGRDFSFEASKAGSNQWSWKGARKSLHNLAPPSLAGDVQLQNASAILAVIESLGMDHLLTREHVSESLTGVDLPGRFQVIDRQHRFILDVAHNPDAARVLSGLLRKHAGASRVTAVVGMLADKDVSGFIAPLCEHVDTWIAVTVAGARAESAASLARQIAKTCGRPCLVKDDIPEALEIATKRANEGDVVLVTGSFYCVGPALKWLRDN